MTETPLELIGCPESTCGQVAEICDRFTLASTDGPIVHVKTYCVNRHCFILPTDHRLLVWEAARREDGAPSGTDRVGTSQEGRPRRYRPHWRAG